ncbi:MAG: transcriptional regulator NrdR [Nitrospirae bacterium GWF2_44_13]|nr:MAG: transcriptional regulator NrdR [Elusimicrobia bacterium RIFOXYB2_FULL_48_7]OGW30643.1 MAG: transcriptional regulator NrdR [Nitrospirae bacterium GWF2_44_13]OGW63942.1 MAG: transcriptional regulator NrdR [Nitrospirae bacterium RIFOXYA2_FULL_44_9]OGW72284.1 MAG: transcriptional regulator NrdR [Nitrospirae bacterium RIFOXYC2_FULL_44_7]HBG93525.1 transcriptional regulator NrdR [Nitrospiraceae bacterium]
MKCPFCVNLEDKVIDSRTSKEGDAIRRRRECLKCGKRFTSYERVEDIVPMVVKKDGRREPFDRPKILRGLEKACEKRPVSVELLEGIVDSIEKKLINLGVKEIQSTWVGEEVMSSLRELDKVAYVRFASVYRQFKDISELMNEVKTLFEQKGSKQ